MCANRLGHWGFSAFSWLLLLITKLIQPNFGVNGLESLARAALPFAFATAAMAVAVIVGGIDLSVASMMAVCSVTAAVLMEGGRRSGDRDHAGWVGTLMGLINGTLIVVTRVPDIVVTLAMLFVWQGTALLILASPGGAARPWMRDADHRLLHHSRPAQRADHLVAVTVAAVWLPIRRSKLGLAIYATGSTRLAAFRSGVATGRTKAMAYGHTGLFSACGGLSLTCADRCGRAGPGPLPSGRRRLGRAGRRDPRRRHRRASGADHRGLHPADHPHHLTLAGFDPNVTTIVEGTIMVGVVMFGAFLVQRSRRQAA